MADLLGGTTGQILSKATNADMDFTWIANDQGDITGVTATSPLTGGGTSGAITVGIQASSTTQSGAVQLSDSTSTTSSVLAATPTAVKSAYDLAAAAVPKSTVTTAGDVIYATGSSAVTRLGIGTAGQVLTVNGGATAPSWATPASGGGMTILASGTLSGASVDLTSINQTYTDLVLEITDANWATADDYFIFRMNNESGNFSSSLYQGAAPLGSTTFQNFGDASRFLLFSGTNALRTGKNSIYLTFPTYATSKNRPYVFGSMNYQQTSGNTMGFFVGYLNTALAINRITFSTNSGYSFTSGSYKLWGVK
jgi:hypothetical protein